MADRGDAFLKEVDEELRKEQLAQLWQRHGTWIAAGFVLVVASVAGVQYWRHRQVVNAEAAGVRYEQAIRQLGEAPSEAALKSLSALATEAPKGYRAIARLRIAGEHAKAGRPKEALAEYEALAADTSADQLLRDYASLQAAMLRIDAADWTEIENRLNPLVNGNSAWRSAAREGLAIAALKAGKTDVARQQLEQLMADRSVPPSMLERVQLLLTVLTDQDVKPASAPAPAVAPAPAAAPAPAGGAAVKDGAASAGDAATPPPKN